MPLIYILRGLVVTESIGVLENTCNVENDGETVYLQVKKKWWFPRKMIFLEVQIQHRCGS